MRTSAFLTVAGVASLLLTGCGWFGGDADSHSSKGGVAVLDLDEVAKILGRDTVMANSLKERQESLSEQLKTVQASYVKQIDEKKTEFGLGDEGVELTDEQTKTLLGMQRQAGLQLNEVRQKAINNLSAHRVQLISAFRSEVKPIAESVAAELGMSIVITKNDSVVFSYVDTVDITKDVASRLKAHSPPASTGSDRTATKPADGTQQR